MNLHGWRQPKRGRWRIEMPRLSLPVALTSATIIAVFLGLLVGFLPELRDWICAHFPAVAALPIIGATSYTWDDVHQMEDSIASGRFSAEVSAALPGMSRYSLPARRDAALAELLASGVPVFNASAARFGASPAASAAVNTTGLQAAMDAASAAGGGIVLVPAGTFNYNTLKFYSLVTLQGAGVTAGGVAATVLYQATAAAPLLQPNNPAVGTKGFCIRDISFSSFGNANNTGGLDLTGSSLFDIDRVHVSGAKVYGIQVVGIAPAGNSGFGNFSRVLQSSLQSGAVAWLFGSNTTLDQPDGLNFWGCYTNVASDVVAIRSTGPIGGHGPGCHVWTGCRFELGNAGTQTVVDVDAQGYGADFVCCRFETFGANQTYNLVGVAYSGGIAFYRTTIATSGGTVTVNDTGAIPTQWFACGPGVGGVGRVSTILDGLVVRSQTVTTNTTLNGLTTITLVDATSGAITISLPDPTTVPGSVWFRIVKKDSSANAVTINAGAKTINGVTTKVMHQQYQCLDVMSDGTNWFTTGAHGIAAGVMELMAFSALRWDDGNSTFGYIQIDGTPKFNLSLNGSLQMNITTSAIVPSTAGGKTLGTPTFPFGNAWLSAAVIDGSAALVSGVTPAIDARAGNYQTLTILTNIAVVIAVPTNPPGAGTSQDLHIAIRNGSGGALTTPPTFNTGANGFKFAGGSIVNPGNGTQVLYHWRWDPVQLAWYLIAVSAAL